MEYISKNKQPGSQQWSGSSFKLNFFITYDQIAFITLVFSTFYTEWKQKFKHKFLKSFLLKKTWITKFKAKVYSVGKFK